MSVETERRRILSEWRIIMVSQTSHPIMYQVQPIERYIATTRCCTKGYVTMKIPIGSPIITKWQEQVRPIDQSDDHWYVVRQWTEAEM